MEVSHCISAISTFAKEKGRNVRILAKVVMPEHVHFVLYVEQPMDCRMGNLVQGFKQGCNKALRSLLDRQLTSAPDRGKPADGRWHAGDIFPTSPHMLQEHALFEPDFDETRLRSKGQLRTMLEYVHNNPRHRWLRQHKPGFLLPTRNVDIDGEHFDAIGNLILLGLSRHQVLVHSYWTDAERRNYMNGCILKARRGAALVSPFISESEQQVRDVALREGHSIIQLVDNGFSDFSQCPGNLYDYCVQGQVLLLVPSAWPHIERKHHITRKECLRLNALAERLCQNC